jgi:hypothetical protein
MESNSKNIEELKSQMDDSINKLKNEITYKKIYQDKHIHISVLESIENMDFDRFIPSTTRASGFIKILEKSYGVNLQYWLIEYDKYVKSLEKKEATETTETTLKEEPKKEKKESIKKDIKKPTPPKLKSSSLKPESLSPIDMDRSIPIFQTKGFQILVGAITISILLYLMFLSDNKDNTPNTQIDRQSVEEAKEILTEIDKNKIVKIEYNSETATEEAPINSSDIESSSIVKNSEPKVSEDSNSATEQNLTEESSDISSELVATKELKVIPKRKLWLGVIELDGYKKRGMTVDTDGTTIDLKDNSLILTGHGMSDFKFDGDDIVFDSRASLRFLYKDGEFKQIDKDEFLRLNRGLSW